MPIFEYECTDCGEHVEHLQLSSDSPLSQCPKCGGEVRKLMSAPAFQFKGTGWYVTDYAGKGESGGSDKDSGAGTPAKDDSGSSSTSKDSGAGDSGSKESSKSSSAAKTSSPAD
ncbi:MAG: FmdB family zinc ribbon protein [Thermoanaerobaculia bacterium]